MHSLCPQSIALCNDSTTQELELANRYLSTVDALLASAPNTGISRHMAAAASLAGGSGLVDRGSPSATAAASAAAAATAAAVSDPATASSLGGLCSGLGLGTAALDAHIRRTLEGQAARLEAAEVRLCVGLCLCVRGVCKGFKLHAIIVVPIVDSAGAQLMLIVLSKQQAPFLLAFIQHTVHHHRPSFVLPHVTSSRTHVGPAGC